MNAHEVIEALQSALNSTDIQAKYGCIFAKMSAQEKVDFQVVLLLKLAKEDANIRDAIGEAVWHKLRENVK